MTLFGPDSMGTVTRISPGADGWAAVYVGRRRVARVPGARLAEAGIAEGVEWTAERAAAAALAGGVVRARRRAVALLRVKARSTQELRERLLKAGIDPRGVEAALAELTREGLLNDEALAEHVAERDLSKGLSARGVTARLAQRGLALEGIPGSGGELERAIAAARARASRLPAGLDAGARFRRVLAGLARLGYEEEVAREAAGRVLGLGDQGAGS